MYCSTLLTNLLHSPFLIVLVDIDAISVDRGGVGLNGYASMEATGAASDTSEVILEINCDLYGVLSTFGTKEQLG